METIKANIKTIYNPIYFRNMAYFQVKQDVYQ